MVWKIRRVVSAFSFHFRYNHKLLIIIYKIAVKDSSWLFLYPSFILSAPDLHFGFVRYVYQTRKEESLMKKFIISLLIGMILVGMTGCGNKIPEKDVTARFENSVFIGDS